MHAVALFYVRADRRVADNLHARGALLYQEDRRPFVDRGVWIRYNHDQQESREAGMGGKPFLAVDHPVVTVSGRGAQKLPRIGPRLGFCHRIAGGDFCIEQGLEVLFFLLRCPEFSQNFCVARVRRLTAKYAWPEAAAT